MWDKIKSHKVLLLTIVGIVLLALVPISFPTYWLQMLTQVIIMALFATSINIEMGYAGMMPLGQTMFMGFGAYAYAILFAKADYSLTLAIIGALVLSLLLNAVIGFLCLRGEALTFGLLHMGFNIFFTILVAKWITLTGGNSGITGALRPELFSSPLSYYYLVLIVIVICYLLIWMVMNSPFGKVANGLRENEERLRYLGINTRKYQLVIFIIAGFFSAVAGILLAMLNRGAFPDYISVTASAQGMMMCLIGGMLSFMGPTLGAIIIVMCGNITSIYTKQWEMILGAIMIVVVIGFRGGILRARRLSILTRKVKVEEAE